MQWLIPTQQFFVLFNQNPRAEYIAFLRREAGELDLPLDGTAAGLGFTGCVVWDGLDMPAGLKHLMVIKCERCFLCLDTRNPQPFSRPWALSLTWAFHLTRRLTFTASPRSCLPSCLTLHPTCTFRYLMERRLPFSVSELSLLRPLHPHSHQKLTSFPP